MVKASVIIPTYNDSGYLERCVRSVAGQPGVGEIVVVDDCSTEPFAPALGRFLASVRGLSLVRNHQNMGLSASRNIGVGAALNPVVFPLDCDDYAMPGVVAVLAKKIEDGFDVAYGDMEEGSCGGAVARPFTGAFSGEVFAASNPIYCSSAFTRSLWKRVGGYREVHGVEFYEDYDFWCRCFVAGARFGYAPGVVYYHTFRPGGMLQRLKAEGQAKKEFSTRSLRF